MCYIVPNFTLALCYQHKKIGYGWFYENQSTKICNSLKSIA